MLEFRCIAALALWTMLSGPVFVRLAIVLPPGPPAAPSAHSVKLTVAHNTRP